MTCGHNCSYFGDTQRDNETEDGWRLKGLVWPWAVWTGGVGLLLKRDDGQGKDCPEARRGRMGG